MMAGSIPPHSDSTGKLIVTASADKTARIWDASTGEPVGKPLQHDAYVFAAAFDPKGERVVTASYDKTARIWDARTGEPIGKPLQHEGPVYAAAFDPEGERVVTASKDGTARIWDAASGRSRLASRCSTTGLSMPRLSIRKASASLPPRGIGPRASGTPARAN